jgi:hypothetical protein
MEWEMGKILGRRGKGEGTGGRGGTIREIGGRRQTGVPERRGCGDDTRGKCGIRNLINHPPRHIPYDLTGRLRQPIERWQKVEGLGARDDVGG